MNRVLNKNKKLIKIIVYIILLILLITLLYNNKIIKDIFSIVFGAFILSYSLKPFHNALLRKGVKSNYASIILILFVIISAILIITILIPSIFKESINLGNTIEEIQEYSNEIYNNLKLIRKDKFIINIFDNFYSKLNGFLLHIFDKLMNFTTSLGEKALALVVIPIISYYFLCDKEYIENKLLLLCPLNSRKIIKKINSDIDKILGRYIVSQFILCAIVSLITFILLLVLRVKFPLVLSLLNGLLNIIPYFGPIFGMILPIIVAMLTSYKTALYTLLGLYLIQLIEGNILSPKVTGDSVSMHPLAVIILLLVGGELGGFWGMVLAIPIGVIIKVIYDNLNYYIF